MINTAIDNHGNGLPANELRYDPLFWIAWQQLTVVSAFDFIFGTLFLAWRYVHPTPRFESPYTGQSRNCNGGQNRERQCEFPSLHQSTVAKSGHLAPH